MPVLAIGGGVSYPHGGEGESKHKTHSVVLLIMLKEGSLIIVVILFQRKLQNVYTKS